MGLNPFFVRAFLHGERSRDTAAAGASQSLLRQGVPSRVEFGSKEAAELGLNPFFVRAFLHGQTDPLVARAPGSQSLLRQGVPSRRRNAMNQPMLLGLNPFFVRAFLHGTRSSSGSTRRVSIPSSSGRSFTDSGLPQVHHNRSLNPFFVRAFLHGVVLGRHEQALHVSIPSSSGRSFTAATGR